MLFGSTPLVRRVELAEAHALQRQVEAYGGDAFALPLAGGYALYRGPDSPYNKVVGLGFAQLEEAALEALEQRYRALATPVQIELSSHADPDLTCLLARRGYRFTGFEGVLGRALDASLERPVVPAELELRRMRSDEFEAWVEVLATGFSQLAGDEVAAAHDSFDREALVRVFRDMGENPHAERWVAYRDGELAAGANSSMSDGVLQLFGTATHPAHRRRGVQRALLFHRLWEGHEAGCELAVITTQPGSQSQLNAQRAGFSLLYERAVWQLV